MGLKKFFDNHSFLKKHIANFITCAGTVLALAVVIFVWMGADSVSASFWAWLGVTLVALSDMDGQVARRWGQTTKFGANMDKIRDKIIACPLFLFMITEMWKRSDCPAALFIAHLLVFILCVEFLLVTNWILGCIYKKDGSSNEYGKIKTVIYFIALIFWFFMGFLGEYLGLTLNGVVYPVMIILLVAGAIFAVQSLRGYWARWGWDGKSAD